MYAKPPTHWKRRCGRSATTCLRTVETNVNPLTSWYIQRGVRRWIENNGVKLSTGYAPWSLPMIMMMMMMMMMNQSLDTRPCFARNKPAPWLKLGFSVSALPILAKRVHCRIQPWTYTELMSMLQPTRCFNFPP